MTHCAPYSEMGRRTPRADSALIAKGEADLDAGLGIADADLERWLDALHRDETTPPRTPRRNGPPT